MVSVVGQKYEGDITIVPQFDPTDYLVLLSNPSQEMIASCILKGSRATWPRKNKNPFSYT